MRAMKKFRHFRFWCQKVLPLVYDDSLSYYELLCKVVEYINGLIQSNNDLIGEYDELKAEVAKIQEWIDNYDEDFVTEILSKYLGQMIYVWITDTGYIVYYIPEGWKDITFNTTGKDIEIEGTEYGRLVLSLWHD